MYFRIFEGYGVLHHMTTIERNIFSACLTKRFYSNHCLSWSIIAAFQGFSKPE